MPDLETLLADATRSDVPPPISGPAARARGEQRRRRATVATGVVAATVAVLGLITLAGRAPGTSPVDPSSDRVPDVLDVTCTDRGVAVGGGRVAVRRDGAHIRFTNASAYDMQVRLPLQGEVLPSGATREYVERTPPGTTGTVSCARIIDELDARRQPVNIEDPDDHYITVPPCRGPTMIASHPSGAGQRGDPLELTRADHPDAVVVGFPEGTKRLVYTGEELIGWESLDGSLRDPLWVKSRITRCR